MSKKMILPTTPANFTLHDAEGNYLRDLEENAVVTLADHAPGPWIVRTNIPQQPLGKSVGGNLNYCMNTAAFGSFDGPYQFPAQQFSANVLVYGSAVVNGNESSRIHLRFSTK
jgi:hypothetical protein